MANVGAFESGVKTIPGLVAGEDLSSYQYCAVKLSSGSVVKCATLGEFTIGILQDAPDASGKACAVAYGGISQVKLSGAVSQQNRLVASASATLVAQSDPDEAVIAIALSDGVSGDIIPAIVALGTALNSAVVERALANTKIWIGDSSGEAQAFALSGDATMTAGGVVTVTDVTVGSDAAGDILYKSSATALARLAKGTAAQLLAMNSGATAPEWIAQSALAVSNIATTAAGDAAGDLIYRDAATTFERLAKGTAGQALLMNSGATAPEWASVSGDATLAAGGALTVTDVTVGSDAAGDLLYKSSATALARLAKGTAGQVLLMNSGATAPEWASMSGDATIAAGGAVTVTDIATTAAGDAAGDLIYRDAAATFERLAKGTAGQMLLMNAGATAPEWASMSGDATIAAGGAVTVTDLATTSAGDASGDLIYRDAAATFERLAKGTSRKVLRMNAGATAPEWAFPEVFTEVVDIASANVITLNITPVVIVDFSALVTEGLVVSGDALVFLGCVVQLYGGAASYDNNENMTVVYQTGGGGTTVSLTLANFCNGGAAGKMSTIKPIATDVAPDADEDLVIKCSASPFAAAGDRNMRVRVWYSLFSPHA